MNEKIYEPLLDIENVVPILGEISIFAALSEKHLYKLFKALQQVRYKAGEVIFSQGEAPRFIYIIKKGSVKISLEEHSTQIDPIYFHVGECLGESAVIGIMPHTATAIAREDCQLIVLSRESLMNFFEEDKELFGLLILNIARETSRRLHNADEKLRQYVHRGGM